MYAACRATSSAPGVRVPRKPDTPDTQITPPGDFDATYWWPKNAGYDRAIQRMTYTPIDTWSVLAAALQRTGMTPAEAALVMGGNMARVARVVWG